MHPNDEMAPDISIVKKEQGRSQMWDHCEFQVKFSVLISDHFTESRKSATSNDNSNLSDDITPLIQPKTEKSQEIAAGNEGESDGGGTVNNTVNEEW